MKCTKCGTEVSRFQTGTRWCKLCHQAYNREHYLNNKQYYKDKAAKRNISIKAQSREFVKQYLREHPCIDCGSTDIEVLQFDHRDPSLKTGEVSTFLTYSTDRLMKEINKCDVRCANCHVKRTRRQFGWWIDE